MVVSGGKWLRTIQTPLDRSTWRSWSVAPSPMSTKGSSFSPLWIAVGGRSVIVMEHPLWSASHANAAIEPRRHGSVHLGGQGRTPGPPRIGLGDDRDRAEHGPP